MEFVIVTFPEKRDVLIDGNVNGKTNQTLMVEAGNHEFTLSGTADFTPKKRNVLVQFTASNDPMRVSFDKRTAPGV
jgi:hypothetical protein